MVFKYTQETDEKPKKLSQENHNMYSQIASLPLQSDFDKSFVSGYKEGLGDNYNGGKIIAAEINLWYVGIIRREDKMLMYQGLGYMKGYMGHELELSKSGKNNSLGWNWEEKRNELLYPGTILKRGKNNE